MEKLSSGFKLKKFINYVLKTMLYPLNAISIFFIDMKNKSMQDVAREALKHINSYALGTK